MARGRKGNRCVGNSERGERTVKKKSWRGMSKEIFTGEG